MRESLAWGVTRRTRATFVACLLSFSLALLVLATSAFANATFQLSWGNTAPLDLPTGATTDAAGNLYVADSSNLRIIKYSPSGTILAKFDEGGGTFDAVIPTDVAVDSAGNMYVADNLRVMKLSPTGAFITEWAENGSPVDPESFHFGPQAIELDSAGNVYVADCSSTFFGGDHRIQKFDADGNFILSWGTRGGSDSQFQCPTGLGIDSQDDVYVTDNGNNRVQKFDGEGTLLAKWGQQGTSDGRFQGPRGLTVDASNNVYVADAGNSQDPGVQLHGSLHSQVGNPGQR